MGSQGIKRRKRRRPLPKVRGGAEAADNEPPIMWPQPGSGFEASSFSPAGRAQQTWALVRGLNASNRRQARTVQLLVLLVVALLVVPLVAVAIAAVT